MVPVNTAATASSAWRASLGYLRHYPRRLVETEDGETRVEALPLVQFYVVLDRREGEQILFAVTWPLPHKRLVFSDRRECSTGTAGSTGRWGTLPPSKPGGRRRTMTPGEWKAEVRRFIGEEEADRIIRYLSMGKPPLF